MSCDSYVREHDVRFTRRYLGELTNQRHNRDIHQQIRTDGLSPKIEFAV